MGESSNFAQPSIPKFDGDYDHWSLLMENLLRSKEYFDVVKDGVEEPVNEEVLTEAQKKTLADARLKDLKAKNYLFSAIDKSILKTITLKETSKQLWDSMKTKLGHFQYECPMEGKANYAEIDEEEGDVLLMAYTPIQEEKEEAWFLDSGCSNHMSGDKSWFSKLDEDFRCSVKLGNNSRLSVIGKGDVNLCVNGRSLIISDVYLIPELTSNLVSLGQFVQKGCEILMHHGVCKLYHPDLGLIMQSRMTTNRLFKIMATKYSMVATEECLKTTTMDDLQLWHRRYGHLNYKGLRKLKYQNMVRGIPHLNTEGAEKCVSCLVGKQHRESIPKKSLWRSSRRLQLKIKESEAEQLVWEDRESEVEENMEEAVQERETEQNEEGVQDTVPIPIQTPTAQRIRRKPAYLLDYETRGEEEDEEIAGLVLFVSNNDPTTLSSLLGYLKPFPTAIKLIEAYSAFVKYCLISEPTESHWK
ncbi:hypothetical protein SASPL_120137 [Salvia splendens]|uniref:GAG-pre-integrase domain-containing protein n=1 Tax=Salvia splendens TaxID=180675 RepID=A0A8X8XPY3_SALSN|nr:hypothetical protein SASPL_120137 [Salvia splendens]